MKISTASLYRYRVPFKKPVHLGGQDLTSREGLLLQVKDTEGREGWGEAAPLPGFSTESLEEAQQVIATVLPGLSEYSGEWNNFRLGEGLPSSVKFAVESALLNLAASKQDVRPCEILKPGAPDRIEINRLLTGHPEFVMQQVREYAHAPGAVKLKVGRGHLGDSATLVCQIRACLPDTRLRLDANRAWTVPQAVAFYELVHQASIEYIEEPVRLPAGLKDFYNRTGCPVALDETLREISPDQLSNFGFADAVIIKPSLVGGIQATLKWAAVAHGLGMRTVISAGYESGVGTLMLAHLAAALPGLAQPAGLDTYHSLAEEVLEMPLHFDRDFLVLPESGREPEIDFCQLERMI